MNDELPDVMAKQASYKPSTNIQRKILRYLTILYEFAKMERFNPDKSWDPVPPDED